MSSRLMNMWPSEDQMKPLMKKPEKKKMNEIPNCTGRILAIRGKKDTREEKS